MRTKNRRIRTLFYIIDLVCDIPGRIRLIFCASTPFPRANAPIFGANTPHFRQDTPHSGADTPFFFRKLHKTGNIYKNRSKFEGWGIKLKKILFYTISIPYVLRK
jgi:hypothetical protein